MISFIDGPAAGQTLMLRRAPVFLRVTFARGTWDALDQLTDVPEPGEQIFAYELTETPTYIHINCRPRRGGFFAMAKYRCVEIQPGDEQMRSTEPWREWTKERGPDAVKRLKPQAASNQ